MKRHKLNQRQGFTLLELVVATAMLALISASSVALVRTAYSAWNRHEEDNQQRRAATTVIRHMSRKIRQSRAVQSITPSTDLSGSLSILMPNGETLVWEHDNGAKQVRFGVGTATDVLAEGIDSLQFTGYNTLMSPTTEPGLIHAIYASVGVNISRPSGIDQEFFVGTAQVRSW